MPPRVDRYFIVGSVGARSAQSSRRIRITFDSTVGSASMRAIAVMIWRSTVRCVSRMMSVWFSPSAGSRCSTASIEMRASARMRVMSASTPGSSATRSRR